MRINSPLKDWSGAVLVSHFPDLSSDKPLYIIPVNTRCIAVFCPADTDLEPSDERLSVWSIFINKLFRISRQTRCGWHSGSWADLGIRRRDTFMQSHYSRGIHHRPSHNASWRITIPGNVLFLRHRNDPLIKSESSNTQVTRTAPAWTEGQCWWMRLVHYTST